MNKHRILFPVVYLVRHATPDWSRVDLPYHLPPGPSLVPLGEAEAAEVGRYLRQVGVQFIWYSPLERTRHTAEIAATITEAIAHREDGLRELQPGETVEAVRSRFEPVWDRAVALSTTSGPVALVTHGGPIAFMLDKLQLPGDIISHYKRLFDRGNPVPPGGVWKAARPAADGLWDVSLAFVPDAYRGKLMV